jgi:hypothetical protein
MEFALGSLLVRAANALVWSIVVMKILRNDRPVSGMARKLISLVLVPGFWVLALGGLVPFSIIESDAIRIFYTAYTAVALIIGVTLAMEKGGP